MLLYCEVKERAIALFIYGKTGKESIGYLTNLANIVYYTQQNLCFGRASI